MRGILLAGGDGTRLYPMTRVVSKQLLPVYDKPLVYYPLTTLMLSGVREILVITRPRDAAAFEALLGDGSALGLSLSYAEQPSPAGIAEALLIGRGFLGGGPAALVLGDNLFFGAGLGRSLQALARANRGATIFATPVRDPGRYGVVELDGAGRAVAIEEKPASPRSSLAIPGLYFYDGDAPDIAASLRPSPRGELEISDVNRAYLARDRLDVTLLGRGAAWLDVGTPEALAQAAAYVEAVQDRQGLLIGSPEEVAFRLGLIDARALRRLAEPLMHNAYGQRLLALADGGGGAA
ncbi:MAG: glucose-1-phosphate thymidylyltransferase [Deltaproteobacteria bacterium HGW-Deltaproteobacteria-14]|jgi:glucose-1-phosphate thymidylyltransferase|nr:MAG: glucose-1-phosphate thymidylyltransferase [Deltaproteobacteria bacterium HGW-Deltaproteobacteria-14]